MYARNQTKARQTSDNNALCCSVRAQHKKTENGKDVQLRRVVDEELGFEV